MKKCLVLIAALALVVGLAACSSSGSNSGAMADGVYTAEADDAYVESNGYGWRDTLTLTYQDGKLTDAQFESYDADGNAKSVPGNYEGMEPEPSTWIPELSQNVLDASSPDAVDIVAGATMSSDNARQLYAAILQDGKPGQTIQVDLST